MEMKPLFLKVDQCGILLGCHKSKVYSMIGAGELPSIRIGGMLRVPRVAIDEMVARALAEHQQCEQEGGAVVALAR